MATGVKGTGPWSASADPEVRKEAKKAAARAAYQRRKLKERALDHALQTAPAVRRAPLPAQIGAISVQTVETHTASLTMRRQSVGQMVDDYLDGLRGAGKRVMSIAIELPADAWKEP